MAGKAGKTRHEAGVRPWYGEGVRFQCQSCGRCCGGDPGVVWVTREEQERMAGSLGLEPAEFTRRHLRRVGLRLSLKERPNGDCVLLAQGCTVYRNRPLQCRTFPFWAGLLRDEAVFLEATRHCPGLGKGRLYSQEEMELISRGLRETGGSVRGK